MDYYVLRLTITDAGDIYLDKALCDNFVLDFDTNIVHTTFQGVPIEVAPYEGTILQYKDPDKLFPEFTVYDESKQAIDKVHRAAIIDMAVDYILQQESKLAKVLKNLNDLEVKLHDNN